MPPTARAGWSQALQHGYAWGDRTLGVMPLYHTMGIHSLLAMHLVGGCFVAAAALGRRRGAPPDRGAARSARCTSRRRCSTTSSTTRTSARPTSPPCARSDTPGAAMTSSLVRRCVDVFRPEVFVNHYGSTEIYTFTIGRDQLAKPGCAGRPAVNTRLRLDESGEILVHLGSDEASPATGTARTPTRRRSRTAGTGPATPGTSTRTATCGSTGGSTT